MPPDIVVALESLPESYAHALRLRILGLDVREIATVLGIPESAVRPLLRVADSKLIAALDNPPATPSPAPINEQGEAT